jgi:hypothetical protein
MKKYLGITGFLIGFIGIAISVPLKLKNPHNLLNYMGLNFIFAVWTGLN